MRVAAISSAAIVVLTCGLASASIVVLESEQWLASAGGNDKWYQLIEFDTGDVTWHTARDTAETLTYQGRFGHLATFSDDAEWLFVRQNLLEPRVRIFGQAWIGATDEISEGDWRWVTGEPWTWEISDNHYSGKTAIFDNLNNEDYAVAWLFDPPIKWNDVNNARNPNNRAVIEYGGSAVPEPSTLLLFCVGIGGLSIAARRQTRRRRAAGVVPAASAPGL